MHLILEGAMKFLLTQWFVKSHKTIKKGNVLYKINSRKNINQIQMIIRGLKFPSSVKRKDFFIEAVNRWKASEYKFFLLYIAPIVLTHFMQTEIAVNFLSFALGWCYFSENSSPYKTYQQVPFNKM